MKFIMYGRFGSRKQMEGIEKLPKDRTYISGNEVFVIGKDYGKTINEIFSNTK